MEQFITVRTGIRLYSKQESLLTDSKRRLSPVVGPHSHHGHRRDGDHRRRRSLLRRRHPLQRPVGPRLWPPEARGEGRVGTCVPDPDPGTVLF
jgi:hypothetical protein